MKYKQILLTVLIFCLCLGLLAACGPASPSDSSGTGSSTTTASTTQPTQSEETPSTTASTTTSTESTEPTEPTTSTTTTPSAGTDTGADIAALAKTLVGTAFKWGAAGPDEFDNSGLVYYCYKQNGVDLPRLTSNMYAAGTAVERADLQPGDVVFFSVDTDGEAQFAGIYVGDNQFVSSNNEDKPTCIYSMSLSYFDSRYVGARRY